MGIHAKDYRQLLDNPIFGPAQRLGELVALLKQDFQCERVSIFLRDRDQQYISAIAEGLPDMDIDIKPGEGLVGKAIERQEILISNKAAYDVRSLCRVRDHYTGFQTRSLLVAPFYSKPGAPVGVVQFINKLQGDFGLPDQEKAAEISSILGVLAGQIPKPIFNYWSEWLKIVHEAEPKEK